MHTCTNAETEPARYNLVLNISRNIGDIISGRGLTLSLSPSLPGVLGGSCEGGAPGIQGAPCSRRGMMRPLVSWSQLISTFVSLCFLLTASSSFAKTSPLLSSPTPSFQSRLFSPFLKFDLTRPPPSRRLISSPSRPPSPSSPRPFSPHQPPFNYLCPSKGS